MSINPCDAAAEQSVLIEEPKIAAGNLTDHERMHQYAPIQKRLAELGVGVAEVIHRNRRVGQYHRAEAFGRLRAVARKSG